MQHSPNFRNDATTNIHNIKYIGIITTPSSPPPPPAELFRAAVYQLHQREAAAALQPHHVRPGAGGVPAGGH